MEKEMATHSSILACIIPRPEKPGGLQSMGSQRVGSDLATKQQQRELLALTLYANSRQYNPILLTTDNHCVLSRFSHVWLFATPGLQPTRLFCPWGSSGKNTRVGCHVLLQGIFPTQGLNPCLLSLLHWQAGSLPLVPPGKPRDNH